MGYRPLVAPLVVPGDPHSQEGLRLMGKVWVKCQNGVKKINSVYGVGKAMRKQKKSVIVFPNNSEEKNKIS